jgi:hypothetical protein
MGLLERPSKMKVEEFLEIHRNESPDVISLLNEYNTLLLFTLKMIILLLHLLNFI